MPSASLRLTRVSCKACACLSRKAKQKVREGKEINQTKKPCPQKHSIYLLILHFKKISDVFSAIN